jgi:hypothetical protein
MVRINVNIEKEKHRNMKKLLIDKDLSITDFLKKCIDDLLKQK